MPEVTNRRDTYALRRLHGSFCPLSAALQAPLLGAGLGQECQELASLWSWLIGDSRRIIHA